MNAPRHYGGCLHCDGYCRRADVMAGLVVRDPAPTSHRRGRHEREGSHLGHISRMFTHLGMPAARNHGKHRAEEEAA